MTGQDPRRADEVELRSLVEDWAEALRAKDVDRLWRHYAPEIVSFDLAPPLRHGAEARDGLEAWFRSWRGRIGYEIRDLVLAAGDDVAWGHSLNRMHGTRTDGEQTDVWFRATLCFRKIGGSWQLAHEHTSVPFYMDGSYRAAVDLSP